MEGAWRRKYELNEGDRRVLAHLKLAPAVEAEVVRAWETERSDYFKDYPEWKTSLQTWLFMFATAAILYLDFLFPKIFILTIIKTVVLFFILFLAILTFLVGIGIFASVIFGKDPLSRASIILWGVLPAAKSDFYTFEIWVLAVALGLFLGSNMKIFIFWSSAFLSSWLAMKYSQNKTHKAIDSIQKPI